MPQCFRIGNPHTNREIDALWREMHRAQQRVRVVEVEVAAPPPAEEPEEPSDDFKPSNVLIGGGACLWPTHAYILPTWNFTESNMTSQFTHPAQWAVWADYRDDLYRTIVLDLHRYDLFYNPGSDAKVWREETGSATSYQPIWQETVGDDSYEVQRNLTTHRNSYVELRGGAGSLWVRAYCYRNRVWHGYKNGVSAGGISISQMFEVRSDTGNLDPLTCADVPAAINAGGLPAPSAYRIWFTFNPDWAPSVSVPGVYAHIHIPETAVAA